MPATSATGWHNSTFAVRIHRTSPARHEFVAYDTAQSAFRAATLVKPAFDASVTFLADAHATTLSRLSAPAGTQASAREGNDVSPPTKRRRRKTPRTNAAAFENESSESGEQEEAERAAALDNESSESGKQDEVKSAAAVGTESRKLEGKRAAAVDNESTAVEDDSDEDGEDAAAESALFVADAGAPTWKAAADIVVASAPKNDQKLWTWTARRFKALLGAIAPQIENAHASALKAYEGHNWSQPSAAAEACLDKIRGAIRRAFMGPSSRRRARTRHPAREQCVGARHRRALSGKTVFQIAIMRIGMLALIDDGSVYHWGCLWIPISRK
ncbi:hypothetical protein HDU87_000857 [Geranomyces variabilis]|uniref:Uncharacterized protein n=1 Tax=Geranomyces variabilis TaxID=109894 RepID=A0AAD5TC14_9FUNG|nr:hypothetical protein HDU87_000857 [Geranomyces variabilis]